MNDDDWQAVLAEACEHFKVPGASLALSIDGTDICVASGVTSIARGARVTTDTIFALGSITKSFTAMLALAEVEASRLHLDADARKILPEFPFPDVTLRHLLSHKAGFFGDILDGPSVEADAIAAYVDASDRFEPVIPPATGFSYNNAAFVVAARITELSAGEPWERLFASRITGPLGLTRTGVGKIKPDENTARPHATDAAGGPIAMDEQLFNPALAPAGATAWTTASDLRRFGFHLAKQDVMTGLETPGPTPTFATGWGLGVQRFTEDGSAFGHDGAVAGQNSFLRIVPAENIAFALLSNGGDARGLFSAVFEHLEMTFGRPLVDPVPAWPDVREVEDAERFVGDYAVSRYRIAVREFNSRLQAQFIPSPDSGDFGAPIDFELRPQPDDGNGNLFLTRLANCHLPTQQRFSIGPDGRRFILFRGRLIPEVSI